MVSLDMLGALSRYRCFPHGLKRSALRKSNYHYKGSLLFALEIIRYARSSGRSDVVFDIAYAVLWRLTARALRIPYDRARCALERKSPRFQRAACSVHPGEKRFSRMVRY